MISPLLILATALLILFAGAITRRLLDIRMEQASWEKLANSDSSGADSFDPAMVSALPEPARRYFNFMIKPGAALKTAVELDMVGTLGLGPKDKPGYRPMRAQQILSPPHGFVWKVKTGAFAGSDGYTPTSSWTRFWIMGLLPIVRASGQDHRRAAFGRVIAEAVAWSPASLLPGENVSWTDANSTMACVTVQSGGLTQSVDIHIDETGRPVTATIQRWTNANPEKIFRLQPFGAYMSDFRRFEGYHIATQVEVGNHFGTEDYFPFFKARITDVRFSVRTNR